MRRCCVSAILQIYSVSIHAPWEGCDRSICPLSMRNEAFQFTHPGKGATDILRFLSSPGLCFNSRTLGRVRPTGPYLRKRFSEFQFTHPGKGATALEATALRLRSCFNSRTLGRVRPVTASHSSPTSCFNSRTLGRVRQRRKLLGLYAPEFQFTHPGKGATPYTSRDNYMGQVSIHAPWEGCDVPR